MRTTLAVLLTLSLIPLAPLAVASVVLDPQPICTYNIVNSKVAGPADACVDVDLRPEVCVHAWATVYQREVRTPGASVATPPVDVGPVHVSPVTVTVDSVWVATVPQKGFDNKFCTTSLLA